jgi:hypothetical protein
MGERFSVRFAWPIGKANGARNSIHLGSIPRANAESYGLRGFCLEWEDMQPIRFKLIARAKTLAQGSERAPAIRGNNSMWGDSKLVIGRSTGVLSSEKISSVED